MMTKQMINFWKVIAFIIKLPAIWQGLMYVFVFVVFFLGLPCPSTHVPLETRLGALLWLLLAILYCFPNRILIRRKWLSISYLLLTGVIMIATFTTGPETRDFLTCYFWRHNPTWLWSLPFVSAPLSLLVRMAIKRKEEKMGLQQPAGG
jgi:hypothetical protein